MTDEELAAIEARAALAPAGPWHGVGSGEPIRDARGRFVLPTTGACDEAAVFIAHAREDVPALAAEVRRQRDEIARLRAEVAVLRAVYPYSGHLNNCGWYRVTSVVGPRIEHAPCDCGYAAARRAADAALVL